MPLSNKNERNEKLNEGYWTNTFLSLLKQSHYFILFFFTNIIFHYRWKDGNFISFEWPSHFFFLFLPSAATYEIILYSAFKFCGCWRQKRTRTHKENVHQFLNDHRSAFVCLEFINFDGAYFACVIYWQQKLEEYQIAYMLQWQLEQ